MYLAKIRSLWNNQVKLNLSKSNNFFCYSQSYFLSSCLFDLDALAFSIVHLPRADFVDMAYVSLYNLRIELTFTMFYMFVDLITTFSVYSRPMYFFFLLFSAYGFL